MLNKISSTEMMLKTNEVFLAKYKKSIFFGEGINDPKGIFGTTLNLFKKNKSRVLECPISENGFTGLAIGAALNNFITCVIHQRVDFSLLALEQVINNAAKTFFVSVGKYKVPITIRCIIGRGWGQGPQHSQSLENIYGAIPGLKVVMPSLPKDFSELYLAALLDPNPVIFIEHRWCHYNYSFVDSSYFKKLIKTKPKIQNIFLKKGKKASVVANSYNIIFILNIMKWLKEKWKINPDIDLIDMKYIDQNDKKVFKSVNKTGNLFIFDIGHKFMNFSSEVISNLVKNDIRIFKNKIFHYGLPFYPTPSSRFLAKDFYIDFSDFIYNLLLIENIKIKVITKIISDFKENLGKFSDVHSNDFKGPF